MLAITEEFKQKMMSSIQRVKNIFLYGKERKLL